MSIGFGGNIIPGGPPPPCEGIIIPPGGGIIIPRGGPPGCFIRKDCVVAHSRTAVKNPCPRTHLSNYMATNRVSLSLSLFFYSKTNVKNEKPLLLFSSTVLLRSEESNTNTT